MVYGVCVFSSHSFWKSDKFNDWGGRGCNIFVPVLGGNGTKIAPSGDIFDQPPGQMQWIWGKLADHVGDHVVSSPEGAVLVTSPGTKSSYPRPPQLLNPSSMDVPVGVTQEEGPTGFLIHLLSAVRMP